MSDPFENFGKSLEGPPSNGFAVVPDDGADLPVVTRCLNVATTGTVRVTLAEGATLDLTIAAGLQFSCRARRVHATGTTATGIVGLY